MKECTHVRAAGSASAAKLDAVRAAFAAAFPRAALRVAARPAASGVRAQPFGDAETRRGAVNRARGALREAVLAAAAAADGGGDPETTGGGGAAAAVPHYAVGLEGGLHVEDGVMYCFAWMAVLRWGGEGGRGGAQLGSLQGIEDAPMGLSRTGSFAVPPRVSARVLNDGEELGHACDAVYGTGDGKGRGGLVGIVTHGAITRTSFYSHAVQLALAGLP
ncbi:inosine triphosphate pyrophosphatase-like protein [Tribonema minus]|uniref:inosine/xanthosine triphosphatase n=1 Tax=Tribonema minus TaxID=303371 RepID=A0A835ZMC8_9STRA|nr:inosine triphosphate pyrophosphatase-like protein [Tribonema minus]